jgi:hypothetical protein
MQFTLVIDLGGDYLPDGLQSPNGACCGVFTIEAFTDYTVRDSEGNTIGKWKVSDPFDVKMPPVRCCCGASDTPAPSMPTVLAMPTAAELASIAADAAGLGRSLTDLAGELNSMASVARMPTAASLAGAGVAAELPRENVSADRITTDGRVTAAAGPTGSPRRRNLASRPTKSQLIETILADYRANGKDAANVTFDTAREMYNLTDFEARGIQARVKAALEAEPRGVQTKQVK